MLTWCGRQEEIVPSSGAFGAVSKKLESLMDQSAANGQPVVSAISPATVTDSRFGYQLTVAGPDAAALMDAARVAILTLDGTIEEDAAPVMVANFGSQAMLRLAGATFTSTSKWPVRLVCRVESDGRPAPVLRLTSSEAFGFGTLVGVEGKFKERCQALLTEVSAEMARRLTADSAG